MTIDEGIGVLKAARDMFGGDVECAFLAPDNGGKAKLELVNVDSFQRVNDRLFPETGYDLNSLSSRN